MTERGAAAGSAWEGSWGDYLDDDWAYNREQQ